MGKLKKGIDEFQILSATVYAMNEVVTEVGSKVALISERAKTIESRLDRALVVLDTVKKLVMPRPKVTKKPLPAAEPKQSKWTCDECDKVYKTERGFKNHKCTGGSK